MAFFLGIDGGGSKTECVLADESGAVLARATGPGGNLREVTAELLERRLQELFEAVRGSAALDRLRPVAVCAGFAGAGDAKARAMATHVLQELLQPRSLYVVGDMEVALEAAVGAGPGIVLLSGTGSIAFGRNAKGKTARAGGEGPRIAADGKMTGDLGSGRYIWWRVVQALRNEGGRRKDSPLLLKPIEDAIRQGFGEEPKELIKKRGIGLGREISKWVSLAAQGGDPLAQEILEESAAALTELVVKVLRKLRMSDETTLVSLAGGVLSGGEALAGLVRERLREAAPRARVELLAVSPAEGAARLAQRLWLQEQTTPPA